MTEVAPQGGVKRDTLSKAVRAGKFRLPVRTPQEAVVLSSKSERSGHDSAAPTGMGASNVEARVAASLGALVAVAPVFKAALDVPCGGVLMALPALLAVGLLEDARSHLKLPEGSARVPQQPTAQQLHETPRLHRFTLVFDREGYSIDVEPMEAWIAKKAAMQEDIERKQAAVVALKASRKATAHHLTMAELPEGERFRQLRTHSKQLVDTIKMIAYRAETAMADILRPVIKRPDEARTLLRALYATEADLIPDLKAQTLTVRLHHMAKKSADAAIQRICDQLNATETLFPRTRLRLVLQLGAEQNS